MTYFNKNAELKQGYNAYIDASADDMGTASCTSRRPSTSGTTRR